MALRTLMLVLFVIFVTSGCTPTHTKNDSPTSVLLTLNDVSFDEETGTITRYIPRYRNIIIPESFNGVVVTAIGDFAFFKKTLTKVKFSPSIERIGSYSFSGNFLTSLILPNSIITIESSAFSGNALTSVSLPNSVRTIQKGAFSSNALTSINIPNSVTTLNGFSNNALISIDIPDSVTTLVDFLITI